MGIMDNGQRAVNRRVNGAVDNYESTSNKKYTVNSLTLFLRGNTRKGQCNVRQKISAERSH